MLRFISSFASKLKLRNLPSDYILNKLGNVSQEGQNLDVIGVRYLFPQPLHGETDKLKRIALTSFC